MPLFKLNIIHSSSGFPIISPGTNIKSHMLVFFVNIKFIKIIFLKHLKIEVIKN